MNGDGWSSVLLNTGTVIAALLARKGLDTWQLRSTTRTASA